MNIKFANSAVERYADAYPEKLMEFKAVFGRALRPEQFVALVKNCQTDETVFCAVEDMSRVGDDGVFR